MSEESLSSRYIQLEEELGAHNYHPLDTVIERGEGVWVYDVDGKRYLDCLSAYSALNHGHLHPKVVKALKEQADKLTLTSRAFRNDQLSKFYQQICELSGAEMVLPMNTGAEAVESAIKAARKWGYLKKGIAENRAEIIVCDNNFHGRTTTVISFSTEEQYKKHFGPFTPGFVVVPFGDAQALEDAITPNTCAFLVEPIQGEAGVRVPPKGYLAAAAEVCSKNNVLLLADEIQTGLGRTGALFAYEHEGIEPDAVIVGKALGGGVYPISAVLAKKEVLGVFEPGDHGSTFGGNPLACAVACAALDVLEEEKLVSRSAELGAWFLEQLSGISNHVIRDVRGKGLMIGVECEIPVRPFCEELKTRGILCKETHGTVIRFTPPLIIEKEQLAWVIDEVRELF